MWDNVEKYLEPDRPQIMWRMRFACWITKAAHTQNA